jgi:hypothetical protein
MAALPNYTCSILLKSAQKSRAPALAFVAAHEAARGIARAVAELVEGFWLAGAAFVHEQLKSPANQRSFLATYFSGESVFEPEPAGPVVVFGAGPS